MTSNFSPFPIKANSDFSIHNLPYGIFSTDDHTPRGGVALGDKILDLSVLYELGVLNHQQLERSVFLQSTLNDFIALGKDAWTSVRRDLSIIVEDELHPIWEKSKQFVVSQSEATMHLPVSIGDYTDFYSSIEHATNVGKLFRDPENALFPNWKHLPVGYHGRASSIVVSGTPIHRPKGQTKPRNSDVPVFGPSKRLDFELEMAFIIGKPTQLGSTIDIDDAMDHIFGMVLFNDWSARDIQKWEYVPLGPFLGKSFASSVSPWIVTMEALAPFKTDTPIQDPAVLPYLQGTRTNNYDINLEVDIIPDGGQPKTICNSNYKYMYWNMSQQLAHHTINGCNVNIGDMMASGTISGKDKTSYGSLLEITNGGKEAFELANGDSRKFIENHDTITMRGYAEKDGIRVGFGEVTGTILPPKN